MNQGSERQSDLGAPPALLSIIRAARATGDKALERAAKQQLADEYGIEVSFRRSERVALACAPQT